MVLRVVYGVLNRGLHRVLHQVLHRVLHRVLHWVLHWVLHRMVRRIMCPPKVRIIHDSMCSWGMPMRNV